jgi:DNA-binding response OmpR family regulator
LNLATNLSPKQRILIVDDEPHILRLLKLALEKKNFAVDTALNGEVALQKISQEQPAVLITDIDMPRMSGKDLCGHIERDIPDRQFIIFVLTSGTELEHRDWTAEIDNLVFLEKPISVRKLLAMLETYFESLHTL